MATARSLRNALEPAALPVHFAVHPPTGFEIVEGSEAPAFIAPFNLLTTVDDELKARLQKLPAYRHWSRWLTLRTAFVGTTVSEYALLPEDLPAADLARAIAQRLGAHHTLTIIKDIPQQSPLLSAQDNAYADALVDACQAQGFVMVDGQALAYVPIDFSSSAAYLESLPKSARRYIKRRLRDRDSIEVTRVATGAAYADDAVVDRYYALYEAVYAQSDIHFDHLTRDFLAAVLRDTSSCGVVFEYRLRESGEFLGWNLCFEEHGRLVDKYIGLSYPAAKEVGLYFVSWVENLEYALERGLSHYVAGWTDPAVKAMLGASFTPTRHAVYVRQPLLRALARRMSHHFVKDSEWIQPPQAPNSKPNNTPSNTPNQTPN